MKSEPKAVFLDRDGVLIEDVDLVTTTAQLRILPGVPEALVKLREAGFRLVVVTNQPVVARGMATEAEVAAIHEFLAHELRRAGAPDIERFYFCPHHPRGTLPEYRKECDCRKPSPGMLLQAARELSFDLARSFMVGDRISDIIAGHKAGCRTIQVETGKHLEPVIQTSMLIDPNIKPDWTCANLPAAAQWILSLK